jgi:hypothetical protein
VGLAPAQLVFPYFGKGADSGTGELKYAHSQWDYHTHDPYLLEVLLHYIFLGHPLKFLRQLPPIQAVHIPRMGSFITRHLKIEGWLIV